MTYFIKGRGGKRRVKYTVACNPNEDCDKTGGELKYSPTSVLTSSYDFVAECPLKLLYPLSDYPVSQNGVPYISDLCSIVCNSIIDQKKKTSKIYFRILIHKYHIQIEMLENDALWGGSPAPD